MIKNIYNRIEDQLKDKDDEEKVKRNIRFIEEFNKESEIGRRISKFIKSLGTTLHRDINSFARSSWKSRGLTRGGETKERRVNGIMEANKMKNIQFGS